MKISYTCLKIKCLKQGVEIQKRVTHILRYEFENTFEINVGFENRLCGNLNGSSRLNIVFVILV